MTLILNKPLVSFLIAAYNEEKYIADCIESCLWQSYKNVEVCVVDDGSEDKTWEIIKKYQEYGLVAYRFNSNFGKVTAFNKAFEISKGEFVAFMGADDISLPNRIQNSLENIIDYDLIFCDLEKFSDEKIISKKLMQEQYGIFGNKIFNFKELLMQPIVFGGTIFAKKDALFSIFPLNEKLTHEDWWIPLACSKNKPIKYIDVVVIKYRIHKDQMSGNNFNLFKMNYNQWHYVVTRDLFYYELIKKKFDLEKDELNYVDTRILKIKLYKEKSFFKRAFIFLLQKESKKELKNLIIALFGSKNIFKIYKILILLGFLKK